MSNATNEIFDDIFEGLRQIDRHVGGENAGITFHVPDKLDVAAIRERSGKSQPVFANRIGVKVATLKQWEQGRRSPQGPARVLLAMIDAEPDVVARVLSKATRVDKNEPMVKVPRADDTKVASRRPSS